MNALIVAIFKSKENKQYFVDSNQVVWLHGTLLCKRLGYANPTQAIVMHTEPDERQQIDTGKLGKKPWFVNEYGVWGMILSAKTTEAKEFKHELKYKVLPVIRKQGCYQSEQMTAQQHRNSIRDSLNAIAILEPDCTLEDIVCMAVEGVDTALNF